MPLRFRDSTWREQVQVLGVISWWSWVWGVASFLQAVWRIRVEDFPAFVVIDTQGNDFYRSWMP